MKLETGVRAPDFELRDAAGKPWRLQDLRGRKVVLFFYPIDDTPGCTREACDFRDSYDRFRDARYLILGVSPQGAESKKAFAAKYDLNFPLLIDDEGEVAKRYGVWEARGEYEGAPLMVTRSTFVIDGEGRIAHALYAVSSKGHVAALEELLLASMAEAGTRGETRT